MSQNSQENSCAKVYFLIKACNFIKKRLRHRCFPVNFVTFLRKFFFAELLRTTASIYVVDVLKYPKFILVEDKFSSRSNIPLNS